VAVLDIFGCVQGWSQIFFDLVHYKRLGAHMEKNDLVELDFRVKFSSLVHLN
jgi:hypothetical protein